ncbi:MAG: SsrA-binding protein SmpB [Bdellovibrionales bacterium]
MSKSKKDNSFLIQNKKARHNYDITETIEAGISLTGSEVKTLREKKGELLEAFFIFKKMELYLQNAHIPEYTNGGYANHEPLRLRKVLLHREELDRLFSQVKEKGISLVPMKMYIKNRKIKLLIGLGKGKNRGDKRNASREKDDKRQIRQHLR